MLLVVLCLLLSGCSRTTEGSSELPEQAEEKEGLKIVTTIFPPYDFARQIGQAQAEVTMLLKPGMESHSYEPTPADMIRIMNSDIFLYAGGESDVWVEELLAGSDRQIKAYALLDWVDPLEEETAEGMQIREHGHTHGPMEEEADHSVHLEENEYDEHVWTSPRNAMVLVEEICRVMEEADPEHAAFYRQNEQDYLEQLKELDQAFLSVVEQAERKTLVFGDRFPLLYFTKTYGLSYCAAFPGCSMETEPSAATIAYLTDRVKEEEIPVVFHLEMSNGRIAQAIAEAAGAKTAVFYSGHGISAEDLAAGEDYLSLMYRNVEALKEALRE